MSPAQRAAARLGELPVLARVGGSYWCLVLAGEEVPRSRMRDPLAAWMAAAYEAALGRRQLTGVGLVWMRVYDVVRSQLTDRRWLELP